MPRLSLPRRAPAVCRLGRFAPVSFAAAVLALAACDDSSKSGAADAGAASLRDLGGGPIGGQMPGAGGESGAGGQGGSTPDAAPMAGGAGGQRADASSAGGQSGDASAAGGQGPGADAAVGPGADAAGGSTDARVPPEGDAGPVIEPDAFVGEPCVAVVGNLLDNGDFEVWGDAGPEGWGGAETNLAAENVTLVDRAPRCGAAALGLQNRNDGHKRYTVPVANVRAGRHTLVYWVRGHGEIRNAWYGNDYSSYEPAGYLAVDTERWERVSYGFTVLADFPAGIEVIFSLRNTEVAPANGHDDLQVDDASLVRAAGLCDEVVCQNWQECDDQTGQCAPRFDRCADDAGCPDWAACDADHRCAPRPGRCADDADCAATPDASLCDTDAHACVPGNPCAGVECLAWQMCSAGACMADPARCRTSASCLGDLPVCDAATATCVAIDDAANLVRNGGFEDWSVRPIPFHGEPLVPDFWYGLLEPAASEIDPDALVPLDEGHSGARACQIDFHGQPADRFVTEPFNLPAGSYTCGYWVRGHGNLRHRWYSGGGWSPAADAFDVDTDTWTPVHFALQGGLGDLRLIFYASNTLADRGHIQLDDVMCTRNP